MHLNVPILRSKNEFSNCIHSTCYILVFVVEQFEHKNRSYKIRKYVIRFILKQRLIHTFIVDESSEIGNLLTTISAVGILPFIFIQSSSRMK